MVKTLAGLIPLAVGVALYGAAVWFLLARNVALGRWLFAAFLAGHGFVHVMFAVPRPATAAATDGLAYPFDLSQSWLVNAGLQAGAIRTIGIGLVVVIVVGYLLAAFSTVGLLVPEGWWPGLVLASTAASACLLAVAFSPGMLLGFAIDAVLGWLAFSARWTPAIGFGGA